MYDMYLQLFFSLNRKRITDNKTLITIRDVAALIHYKKILTI